MRILVLSRNAGLYSTSRLTLAGRARGHRVDVVDPFSLQIAVDGGAPRPCFSGQILARYDAVIPRIGASVGRFALAILRLLEEHSDAVLNRAAAIALARDKVLALGALAARRIAVPKTIALRSLQGIEDALKSLGGYPLVVKLQGGTQGVGTMLAESPSAGAALLETLSAMGHEIILQQFVRESRGRDVRAVVVGGRLVAAMRRKARAGEFRSNLHRGARGKPLTLEPSYRRAAIRAARILGLEQCGVDMLETKSGPVVIEVNSSPGLEGIEAVTGVDVARAMIRRAEVLTSGGARVSGARALS
jgi:ribosomal protein S6--L-glutamate ligase